MIFKREKIKKRVVCPIPIILDLIQETVDTDAGMSEFIIIFEGKEHMVGLTSDYNRSPRFFDPLFYLDEQEFDTFEIFKEHALLNGLVFANITDEVEIISADDGITKFPWYKKLEEYVVQ